MKNLKYYMFLAAAMLFTGCSQDEEFIDELVPGTQNKLVDITIGTPQEHNSRVSYDDTATPFAWEDGDEVIAVGFAEDGAYKGQTIFRMKDELTDDKKTATFTGALPEGAKQYKVYYKAANLTIATADGSPKVDYGTQSADITSAETQTAHMKNFYQLATPKLTLENLLDPATPKNLKLENSLLRLDVKSYPAAIDTLKNILLRTNVAKGTAQTINIGITNVPAEQKGFKVFMLFDPIVMAQTEGETFEVVFVGDKGAQAISKDNTKATFNKPGSRYNLIAYQDDLEIQDAATSAVLKNWTVWEGATVDASKHTLTTKGGGFITPEMITSAIGSGHELVVKGDINSVDIRAIREAAGCLYTTSNGSGLDKVLLQHLDLSGATIKTSNEFYAKDQYKTEENKIGDWMFTYSGLRSVILPEGITEIGEYAFRANKYLKSVNIPSTVTTLRLAAFMENTALTSIEIPNNVTTVENSLFSNCTKLATVKLSEKMTEISRQMFYQSGLTSITIPASVTTINALSFRESKLTSLVIPATVTYVDEYLLGSMKTLRTLTFEGADTKYNTKEYHEIFRGYTDSKNCDLVIPKEWESRVSMDEDNNQVFEGLVWKSIKFIGDSQVDVDAATHTITTEAPGYITPEIVAQAMGTGQELVIKGSINGHDVKSIREAAGCMFDNSQSENLVNAPLRHLDLSNVTFKASEDIYSKDVTNTYHTEDNKLTDRMFTISALQTIKLPEGITEIGYGVFSSNYILSEINIPSTVTKLGNSIFTNNLKLKTIVIPDNVTSIGGYLFDGCNILSSVKLSEKCEIISVQMFSRCSELKSITIPAAVKIIQREAFIASGLNSLVIPATVDSIDANIIKEVTTLRSLTIKGADTKFSKDKEGQSTTFKGYTDSENCDLEIPAEWKSKVSTSAEGKHMFEGLAWKSITLSGSQVELPEDVDPETHTITTKAAGTITPEKIEFALGSGNELVVKGEINSVDIRAIREAAGCNYDNSQSSSQTLSEIALQHLDLSGATIKTSNEFYAKNQYKTEDNKIGDWMFTYSGLRSVILPEGITEIGQYAFRANKYLTTVTLPSTVTFLKNAAFMESTALKGIEIPNSVTTVEGSVFSDCRQLASVKLSEKMTEIGRQMFYRTKLTSITIPASVTTINESALRETKLSSLVIPATVTNINGYILGKMTTLRTLTFEGSATKFSKNKEGQNTTFKEYTDSKNCDLVIPAEWKSKVSTSAEGKFMFEGLAWKSIKDLKGNDLTATSGK